MQTEPAHGQDRHALLSIHRIDGMDRLKRWIQPLENSHPSASHRDSPRITTAFLRCRRGHSIHDLPCPRRPEVSLVHSQNPLQPGCAGPGVAQNKNGSHDRLVPDLLVPAGVIHDFESRLQSQLKLNPSQQPTSSCVVGLAHCGAQDSQAFLQLVTVLAQVGEASHPSGRGEHVLSLQARPTARLRHPDQRQESIESHQPPRAVRPQRLRQVIMVGRVPDDNRR
mmetsp:Transcript_39506/g.83528  ORF Transcript_39506/g.83528 Transcript_39506/m.83528 type:complete len:224 (+) Transcript_39506:641-1312(+)